MRYSRQATRWLMRRIRTHLALKLAMLVGLPAFFLVGYFGAMRLVMFEPWTIAQSEWDTFVPEHRWAAYIYHSLWLMMPIMPLLAGSRRALRCYMHGLLMLSCSAFAIFVVFPVAGPRDQILPITGWEPYLSGVDLKLNAMPSLHAGLATYSALFGLTIARRWSRTAYSAYLAIAGAWMSLILWSTLATRQHYLIDLPAGMVLAYAVYRLTHRLPRSNYEKLAPSAWTQAVLTFATMTLLVAINSEAAERDEDQQSLRELAALYERAVNQDNVELLKPHLADDFSGIMVTGRAVTSYADLTSYWADIKELLGDGGNYEVKLVPEESIFDGDIAICRGTTTEVATTSSDRFEFSTLWTAIGRKQDGQWKLIRVQGTMDRVTNAFVTTFMTRAAIWSGLGGAGIGLLVGAALTYVIGRRRARARSV